MPIEKIKTNIDFYYKDGADFVKLYYKEDEF